MLRRSSSFKSTLLALVSLSILTSCVSQNRPNEGSGMIIGGIIGGIIGHDIGRGHGRTMATVIGSMIGTSIGGNIGRIMDENDRLKVAHSLETIRTGVSTKWQNPDTGYLYKVVPTRTYQLGKQPCREYQVDATIGGKPEQIFGTACRQADGSWKVKNQ